MIGCIIFDLDGTLLDTLPLCLEAFRRSFFKYTGQKYDNTTISSFFGPSEEGVIKQVVPEHHEGCLHTYLSEYRKLHREKELIFPGIISILELLEKHKVKKAIVSGKGRKSMAISLEFSGLSRFFTEVYTGNAEGIRKFEHLEKIMRHWKCEPGKCYYVGDTVSDIHSARRAGILSIAALWGGESVPVKEILALHPDLHFYTVPDFHQWLEQQMPG